MSALEMSTWYTRRRGEMPSSFYMEFKYCGEENEEKLVEHELKSVGHTETVFRDRAMWRVAIEASWEEVENHMVIKFNHDIF